MLRLDDYAVRGKEDDEGFRHVDTAAHMGVSVEEKDLL